MYENIKDRNAFIEKNKGFIYNVTADLCKKNLQWENDDELSIGLIAFNKACDNYLENKGSFLGYAKTLIKNALIDHFRKSSTNHYLAFENDDNESCDVLVKDSIKEYELHEENKRRAEEIKLLCKELKDYNIGLEDLMKNSPSHKDTKDTLLNIAFACSKDIDIISYIKRAKMLPVKQICILSGANRKMIDKWRRYLLCLITILSNEEYLYIRSYLNIKVGDVNAK